MRSYFAKQETIITVDGNRLLSMYANGEYISKQDKHEIIAIATNHLMCVKDNEPSAKDKETWAQCLVNIFPWFQNKNNEKNYVSTVCLQYIVIYKYHHNIITYKNSYRSIIPLETRDY